ncbi:hypothetical protein [Emticicia sp. SJ17W-69]|uniref:hypothetical protein n=1 Tax=Emticicia sp. SJ17W-69 TaxID=3421657 RepID=UPI003EC11902
MGFLEKAEHFISQLQYSLAIESEPIININGVNYNLTLHPDIFNKLTTEYKVDFPFHYRNKIIELKILMNKEQITRDDALEIIKNYISTYSLNLPSLIFSHQYYLLYKLFEINQKELSNFEKLREVMKINYSEADTLEIKDLILNKQFQPLIQQLVLSVEEKKKEMLIELLETIEGKSSIESSKNVLDTNQEELPVSNLGHREIALLYYYTDKKINANNAKAIAEKSGHSSGIKLLEHYNLICTSDLNITNHRFAVKNIENVLKLLNDNPKAKAKAEKDLQGAKLIKK